MIRTFARAAVTFVLLLSHPAAARTTPLAPENAFAPPVKTEGRHFIDAQGREILLRGINISGNSKIPPFTNFSERDLNPLPGLGFNTIRLLFNWEAFEPLHHSTRAAYLDWLHTMAKAASDRGLYVVVDFHQDGFSRFSSRGCGSGFPRWAIAPSIAINNPDNGEHCAFWGFIMATDPSMHQAFKHFYDNDAGVRDSFLETWGLIAKTFSNIPGVIGYDILNEPWGDEKTQLLPLYLDAAKIIRAEHPGAIMFLEPEIKVGMADLLWFGKQTDLPKPGIENVAYAPHYYQISIPLKGTFDGTRTEAIRGFQRMKDVSEAWNAPVFVGEFGTNPEFKPSSAYSSLAYMNLLYEQLDLYAFSGAQWVYTPQWTPEGRDGWNLEDFSIVDNHQDLRPHFRYRAQVQAVAGRLLSLEEAISATHTTDAYRLTWVNDPAKGATVFYVPSPATGWHPLNIHSETEDVSCQVTQNGEGYACSSETAGIKAVILTWL